jgi:hypothetical protein
MDAVGELGWLVEGLCSVVEGLCSVVEGLCGVVEGLCRLIEGLCSAIFAASVLTAVLSGGNLKYFRFHGGFSTKKRKSAAGNSARFGTYAGLRKALGVLTSIVSISELWMRQREAFCQWWATGMDTVRRSAQYPSEAWAARQVRVTQQSINTS